MDARRIIAPISYVANVSEDEKAYHMMYRDARGPPTTNIKRVWMETGFQDIRGSEGSLCVNTTGIAIRKFSSSMTYDDFGDDRAVRTVYFRELESELRSFLGASRIEVFRYGIRKRHTTFPVSTGEEYEFEQPTSIAHVDATLSSTEDEILKHFGDEAHELLSRRYQWVNVWKPLRGPVNDWPLCLCDASTVDAADIEVTDMVYPDYFTENQSLRFNPNQRWLYLSDHQPDELIIFKQSDSSPTAVGGVPHCSFDNSAKNPDELPRESIEARALVFY